LTNQKFSQLSILVHKKSHIYRVGQNYFTFLQNTIPLFPSCIFRIQKKFPLGDQALFCFQNVKLFWPTLDKKINSAKVHSSPDQTSLQKWTTTSKQQMLLFIVTHARMKVYCLFSANFRITPSRFTVLFDAQSTTINIELTRISCLLQPGGLSSQFPNLQISKVLCRMVNFLTDALVF
jgi:hypothetical protein